MIETIKKILRILLNDIEKYCVCVEDWKDRDFNNTNVYFKYNSYNYAVRLQDKNLYYWVWSKDYGQCHPIKLNYPSEKDRLELMMLSEIVSQNYKEWVDSKIKSVLADMESTDINE